MTDDARIEALQNEQERLRGLVDDIRVRVAELEKESGVTNKAIELEVKAIYQIAESLKTQLETYADSQAKETVKLSDSHERILSELGEVRGRISVIQDKMAQPEVEVNVGDNINAGGDITGRDKTDGTNTIKWLVIGVGLIAAIAIAFGGGFVKFPGGVEVGGAGQSATSSTRVP